MQFEVKALAGGGGIVARTFDAPTESQAIEQARAAGLTVLSVRGRRLGVGGSRRRVRFPLILASQELLALLEAGLSLVEGLETLAEKEHRAEIRRVYETIVGQLYEGQTFSQALGQFPEAFPPLYVATVRASERTGDLPVAITRYIAYQEQLDVVRKKIVSASIYPVLLMGVGGLVTLFLIGYVVPRFSTVFEEVGGNLPFASRVLLQFGQLVSEHGAAAALVFAVVAVGGGWALAQPGTRAWVGRKLWDMPGIGERMRVYQLARFYRTLGMLLRGGTSLMTALEMVEGLLNPLLRRQLTLAAQSLREGKPISDAMQEHGLTTPVAMRMLRVGERTGRMGEMMERIAQFYDDEMARWVDWFTRLFEPLLMAVIGVVIGLIVVLMYMPIFELAGSLE